MSDLTIRPLSCPFRLTMSPPGSKSLTNRALVLAALADGASRLSNVLFADDTHVMLDCLAALGFPLDVDRAGRAVTVRGRGGGVPAEEAKLFCGNSGTTLRFLAALCALGRGKYLLDGAPRMRQRPIGQLADLLRQLGAGVGYAGHGGFPPLEVRANTPNDHAADAPAGRGAFPPHAAGSLAPAAPGPAAPPAAASHPGSPDGPGALPGGPLVFKAGLSSQFLSAVLHVAPYAQQEVTVELEGRQISWPYVEMTLRLMGRFGRATKLIYDPDGEPRRIVVPRGRYAPTDYAIEPDASAATYFLAAAAMVPGAKVTIQGLGKNSLQGDVGFADVLHRMGAELAIGPDTVTVGGTARLDGIDVDLLSMPDSAQTLAVVALFARGPTTMRGLQTLRVKETDRIAALAAELAKLGAKVEVEEESRGPGVADTRMTITPPRNRADLRPARMKTYDDHRMAMSFALAGLRAEGVTIEDAQCVNKTYPEFFQDLEKLRAAGTK